MADTAGNDHAQQGASFIAVEAYAAVAQGDGDAADLSNPFNIFFF